MGIQSQQQSNANANAEDYKLSMSETWYWNLDSAMPIAKADCSFTKDGKQPWNGRIVDKSR